jgi:malonyl CoA-acyl carrier protein transacylase/NAD(P)-dependent dehydrogenase (short-subunit alcohol dehydrogenase family)
MLLANLIAHAAVIEAGIRPDLVTGHSYGEFAAITAAGAWSLASAISAARARVDGIEATAGARGAMLATSAPPQMVEPLATALPERAYLANYNSPDQTVVGGREESLRQLSKLLDVMGHKAQMIPVPCPFHTPLMEGTADLLRQILPTLSIDPPRVPLLSSVTNRYVAEPDEIRDNLAAQLTTPVRYLDLITRIASERDTVFIEIGPQQALTRLNRRILEGRNVPGIIAIDHPKRPGHEQMLHVRALLECVGAFSADGAATTNVATPFVSEPRTKFVTKPQKGSISHVDGTERRRSKMRAAASGPAPARAIGGADAPRAPMQPSTATMAQPAPHRNDNGAAAKPTVASRPAVEVKRAQPARDPKELQQFLINFVVEQTGYPPEVVELDADLEADLGIDSIKKAQLFGELAEYFDVQPDEDMTLDDFPTLRHVSEFLQGVEFKKELVSEAAQQSGVAAAIAPAAAAAPRLQEALPPTAAATVAATSSPSVAKSAATGQSIAELERFLVNFVVEQTGYPPEVVELDADLEADLGIDSIKKAQLFGELAEYFDVQPYEGMTLDDFPTLRHVTEFLQGAAFKQELASEVVSQSSATASPPTVSATAAAPVPRYQEAPRPTVAATIAAVSATAVAEPAPAGQSVAELEQFLVNFVVEQTGYPPEVVELDADLEADLGIDSIKKAQLFGELAEYFDVRPDENMTLDDFPTLRHVVNFLARDAVKKKGVTHPGDSTDFDAAAGVATEAMALASDRPSAPYDLEDASHDVSHRYALRTLPSALPENTPAMPRWFGAAMIVGEGPAAEALNKQLLSAGVTVVRLAVGVNLNQTLAQFQAIWNRQPIYHLFLMQGRDGSALDVADHESWRERRYRLATLPFYLCQRWTQLAAEAKVLNRCTLVAATSLGGDFGFSGGVKAPESGAITGLLKAIFIEYNILRKFDTFLVKAIDAPDDEAPELLAANICRELASREVDYEVAYAAGVRHVQNAYLRASQARQYAAIRPGGVWVLTGGARGITALCGLELGRRFGLQLHLLGSSPLPKVDPAWRALDEAGLKALQSAVMREARAKNQSMDEAWSRVRKDLEIDRTLARFQEAGIIVRYHQCDVADEAALARVLDEIRQTSGPIEGILHGAGIERSCNYERKKPEVVEATLASKVDGALNLMRLTRQDPIRHFVGFGSVSGRLGSNGQTDYCMASDLLCKLTGWYRTWRPEVRAVGIHWHPWAEVGMAATPETAKLLKLSGGPTSMDKVEGVRHLMRELYASDADTEVMITDDDYFGRYYLEAHPPRLLPDDPATDSPPEIAARHQLRLVEAPLPSSPHPTHLTGAACILGDNPAARALRDRLDELSVPVELLPVGDSAADVLAAVERRYAQSRFQHLFLMTGRDAVADPLQDWPSRRARGVTIPFLATQQWFRLRRKAKDSSPITISAATSLGGDFGIASNVAVPDGGALSGLLKSLHIEDSRKPQRELRAKVIDFPETESPAAIAGALIDELTHDDPNVEVAWSNGRRRIVRSFVEPVESLAVRSIEPGSVWVVTGGARGITAAAALEMGKRFRLKLHLIGRSAAPQPDAPWRNYSEQQLAELKTQVVRRAVAEGRSPESDWDRVKHDREIHENLSKFTAAGVTFTYHSCNVADREQLARVLDEIRTAEGRIDGIVHGAGWARSGRFDSRSADVLDKTIAAKLDGAINLITLTADDPIRHWVGFGSISGRYGGNGLSDYAAANEMLAKLLAWYRRARPHSAAGCVPWQCGGEVGMAMLADSSTVGSKGVLKMEFISPREGSNHLCRELAAGLPSPETVITDGYFEQTFYPHIKAEQAADLPAGFAIVDSTTPIEGAPGILAHVQFQPDKDPFLYDHTLRGKPLLPAVVGLEAIAEAAALLEAKPVVALRQVEFREGLSFQPGQPIAARVQVERSKSGALMCQLLSEFKNRAGIVLQKNRVHFIGQVEVADAMPSLNATYSNPPTDWHPFEFRTDGPMVHGPTFQGVNRVTFAGDMGWGELTALSLGNLGGPHRKNNWLVPATLLDAAFYVCGIHLWLNVEPAPALPQSIEALRLGRLPRDGEPAWVQVRCRKVQGRQAIYDFAIFDEQRMPILQVEGYGCVMLKAKTEATVDA